jgi:hypothetical protein
MTIALLVIAALVLMATMLVLTLGVNELEKKTLELGVIVKKRYTIKAVPKTKNKGADPAPPTVGAGGITVPPLGKPPGKP